MPLPDSLVRTGRKSNRKRRHQSTAATDDEATRGADSDSDEEFSAAASPTKRVAKQRGVRVKQEPQDDVTLDTNKPSVQPQQPAPFAFEQPMKRARVLESPDAAAFTVLLCELREQRHAMKSAIDTFNSSSLEPWLSLPECQTPPAWFAD
eukprot:CAMPEP_0168606006 /NCGR_PEP_ID=MMETSP0420-20121227/16301_1 /TAXON_ID=498008 /ORGANISM="Pessonella sp." /LENGTH=149 /DNA_ID=CAMNT_0008645563 /DNA_START=377 /DNA_END=822 /DNA_ORIENTATION=-